MKTTEEELARRIIQHLDFGADHVEPRTRERLLDARKAALSRYNEELQPARGLAWAGGALARRGESLFSPRYLIAGAALIAALIGMAYWQNNGANPANELADIDVGLLTDDLPINAYLDKGFDSWLKRSSH
jgi:hypothetical protein